MTDGKTSSTAVILRVRTPELIADGPPPEALIEIARAALPNTASDFTINDERPTHLLPAAVDFNAFDPEVIDTLADAMSFAAEDIDVVLLDLMLDHRLVRFGAIEQIVYSAAEKLQESWPLGASLIVLMNRVPDEDDDIAQIRHLEGLRDAVLFLDEKGRRLGSIWDDGGRVERVAEAVVASPAEVITTARRRALRRRGVFRVATSPREDYAAFRYSVGDSEMAAVLRGYFAANNVDVVVFESETEEWLGVAVQGAASSTTSIFPVSDLVVGGDRSAEFNDALSEKLKDPATRVCLVIPMLKNGERATALLAALGRDDVDVLTIFHASVGEATVTRTAGDWASEMHSAALDRPVRFIFSVKLKRLRPTHWQVQMARLFHEDIDDLAGRKWKPSRTGLWSLLHARRKQAGYRRRDHGVLMRMELDDWDAGWLAASIMQVMQDTLGMDDGEVLLVLPDDADTAIAAIAEALKTEQMTTVLRVPRDVIASGGKTISNTAAAQIRRFSNGTIVLVDESAATYATLEGLDHVVQRVISRGADLSVVVLDLPEGSAKPPEAPPLVSIYGWRPSERKTYRQP